VTHPRLVATDLDGTLLDPSGQVSARTRAVLDELDRRVAVLAPLVSVP
jgi:hydroxymethylpyrimidine pyrophosphatase-like HAD family hydrolase